MVGRTLRSWNGSSFRNNGDSNSVRAILRHVANGDSPASTRDGDRSEFVIHPNTNEMMNPSDAMPITHVAIQPTIRERREIIN